MEAVKKMPGKGKMVNLVNDTDMLMREENELNARLAEIDRIKKESEAQKEQERLAKIDAVLAQINSLKADCKVFRSKAIEAKVANNFDDEKLYKDSLRDAEEEIRTLEKEFGLEKKMTEELPEETESQSQKIKFFGISTTRAVAAISAIVVILGLIFWRLCVAEVGANPANDGVLRMLNTSGLRLMLNVLFWAASILVGISYIYFFLPDLWRWLHNRIISDVSLKTDFEQCTPYQRLNFFTLNIWLPAFLFALCLLAIMG